MDFQVLAKSLIVFGILLALIGGGMLLAGKLGFRGLPGDIRIERGGMTVFLPIVTCIVLSLVLTVIVNLIWRR